MMKKRSDALSADGWCGSPTLLIVVSGPLASATRVPVAHNELPGSHYTYSKLISVINDCFNKIWLILDDIYQFLARVMVGRLQQNWRDLLV